jgi:hypothetical protein
VQAAGADAQLLHALLLDLPDALAGDAVHLADGVECHRLARRIAHPVPQPDDLGRSVIQIGQELVDCPLALDRERKIVEEVRRIEQRRRRPGRCAGKGGRVLLRPGPSPALIQRRVLLARLPGL